VGLCTVCEFYIVSIRSRSSNPHRWIGLRATHCGSMEWLLVLVQQSYRVYDEGINENGFLHFLWCPNYLCCLFYTRILPKPGAFRIS
jgi:hypothetical protein